MQTLWTERRHWANLIRRVGKIDLGDPLPELDERFVSTWAAHYAAIARMAGPRGAILEIGAGYGVLAAGLSQSNTGPVFATEHPSRAYMSRSGYRTFLHQQDVFLVAQDLTEGLPFRNKAFDQVYGCDVIEHLRPAHAVLLLREIARVLKPHGEFILSTPNRSRLSIRVNKFCGRAVQPPCEIDYAGDTLGHVREFTPRELATLLNQYGFKIIRQVFGLIPYFTFPPCKGDDILSDRAVRWINRATAWLSPFFPSLGDEMYLLIRKR